MENRPQSSARVLSDERGGGQILEWAGVLILILVLAAGITLVGTKGRQRLAGNVQPGGMAAGGAPGSGAPGAFPGLPPGSGADGVCIPGDPCYDGNNNGIPDGLEGRGGGPNGDPNGEGEQDPEQQAGREQCDRTDSGGSIFNMGFRIPGTGWARCFMAGFNANRESRLFRGAGGMSDEEWWERLTRTYYWDDIAPHLPGIGDAFGNFVGDSLRSGVKNTDWLMRDAMNSHVHNIKNFYNPTQWRSNAGLNWMASVPGQLWGYTRGLATAQWTSRVRRHRTLGALPQRSAQTTRTWLATTRSRSRTSARSMELGWRWLGPTTCPSSVAPRCSSSMAVEPSSAGRSGTWPLARPPSWWEASRLTPVRRQPRTP